MVCKEDVVSWFKGSKSHTRLDVMCNLFNLCLPFELRFLGTCLEDLGKRDYQDLRPSELGANNPSELNSADFQCISDKRTRTKLAIFISLLHSCNTVCANGYYKLLANVEEVNNLIKGSGTPSAEDEVLEELLLIYTLALNHPAFTFEQKLLFGSVFIKLRQEEERRSNFRTKCIQGSHSVEAVDKPQIQNYQPCTSPEQHHPHPHLPTTPMNPAALTGDPLVSLNSNPMDWTIPYSVMPSGFMPHHTPHPISVMMPPPAQAPAPESRSPLVSRTNSPCQSNSPSRAGSPGRPKQLPPFNRPPPAPGVEPSPAPPNHQGKGPSVDQLRGLTDDELREQGWTNQCISQLRTLETKMQTTNGYSAGNKRPESDHYCEPTPTPAPTPTPTPTTTVSGMPLRRFNSMDGPLNPAASLYFQYVPSHCLCLVRPKPVPAQLVNNLKAMGIDGDHDRHNSSTSDSASDHSPPDTPSLTNSGPPTGAPVESWDEPRIPEGGEERRPMGVASMPGRGRGTRSARSNPPGMPTLPRGSGRGQNPSHRRRDTNSANGTHEERKPYQTPESSAAPVPFPAFSGHFLPPGQFVQAFPTFTSQGGVFRLPFPPTPNGEMLYHPLPPPAAGQFLPTRPTPHTHPHLPFSPLVPPPKISCYNCGSQGHIGPDCPELTMEEITNKGIFRLDYSGNSSTYQKPGECSTTQDK